MEYLYKNYYISDIANKTFPEKPNLKLINDYESILKRIPDLNGLFDFLHIYNTTGLAISITKWYSYTDGINNYNFSIKYSMFGTCIDQVNSDNYPSASDTGVFAEGSASSWTEDMDISAMDNIWHGYEDYVADITSFYIMNFELPVMGQDVEYYSDKIGKHVCETFSKNITTLTDG